jgi:hypothetical protein
VTWPYNHTKLSYGWPTGLEVKADNYGDHKERATGYCATHENWYYKDKIIIELDWEAYFKSRPPKHLTMSMGTY